MFDESLDEFLVKINPFETHTQHEQQNVVEDFQVSFCLNLGALLLMGFLISSVKRAATTNFETSH